MADVNVAGQLDEIEKRIMAGLKDFQRATVNRIDELYRAGQMRVLVSDEVGLGKTLIARGTIAKLAKLQKESGDKLVKVVYVCSNASIAEQNLNKLRITSELKTESTSSSRLSMQHLNIFRQENDTALLNRYIQLIPLTPDTSFRMTSGAGTVSERALMYAILRRMPELSMYRKALEVAMADKAVGQWDGWARDWYETQVKECDKTSGGKYLAYMLDKLSVELNMRADEDNTVLDMIISMCKQIRSNGYKQQNNNAVIGKLRVIFAKISLDKLEPDLVIMDEFQRFKYLINSDSDTETGMLANKFFNSSKVRMLLLSATPYKMYSTLEEIDETQVNRTYQTYCKKGESFPSFLPSQIAKIFINRMNTAESTATVELACGKKSDDAHWQNLLTYCKQGNLQAMFDEYAHLITNGFDADNNLVGNLHHSIATSMDVRTTIYTVDTFNSFKARANGGKEKATALRSHFAVAFTKGDGKEKDADRKKVIRNAFNSPFRPFVLASTSIGQEGLDFHNYCRRIVHWNLPSNPIDLEQREGRINRFECLAIRQNIAKRYGTVSFKKNIWKEMFDEAAKVENGGEGSDLIPFWGLTEKEDMVRIERIVPMYPFSRDELAYERLIKILSLYRLTLGQARQEELLEYIFKNCDDLDEMKNYFINLSPYYKKH